MNTSRLRQLLEAAFESIESEPQTNIRSIITINMEDESLVSPWVKADTEHALQNCLAWRLFSNAPIQGDLETDGTLGPYAIMLMKQIHIGYRKKHQSHI